MMNMKEYYKAKLIPFRESIETYKKGRKSSYEAFKRRKLRSPETEEAALAYNLILDALMLIASVEGPEGLQFTLKSIAGDVADEVMADMLRATQGPDDDCDCSICEYQRNKVAH